MTIRPWLGLVLGLAVAGCGDSPSSPSEPRDSTGEYRVGSKSLEELAQSSNETAPKEHELTLEDLQKLREGVLQNDPEAIDWLRQREAKLSPEDRERIALLRRVLERQPSSETVYDPEMSALLAWLAESRKPEPAPAASAVTEVPDDAAASDAYSFGLQTRDYQLWLHLGSEPRHYTVKSKDGRVLARAIDDASLERDYPDLHHLVHAGIDAAGGDADYAGIGYDSADR